MADGQGAGATNLASATGFLSETAAITPADRAEVVQGHRLCCRQTQADDRGNLFDFRICARESSTRVDWLDVASADAGGGFDHDAGR